MTTSTEKNIEDARKTLSTMREKRVQEFNDIQKNLKNAKVGWWYEVELREKLDDVVLRGKRIKSGIDFLDGKWTVQDMDSKTAVWVVSAIFQGVV